MSDSRLAPPEQLGRGRALAWEPDGGLLVGSGYRLWRWHHQSGTRRQMADAPATLPERFLGRSAFATRLGRLGFHSLVRLSNGTLVASVRGRIVYWSHGMQMFKTSFVVPRGLRPLNLGVAPNDEIVFGEYFRNDARGPVNVYRSRDGGRSWEIVWTFPAGAVRHVHNVIWDRYRSGWLLLAGDRDNESRICFTRDFRSLEVIIAGDQRARAVVAVPMAGGLLVPMDSHTRPNFVNFVHEDGRVDQLYPLEGSCFSVQRFGGDLFFSTAVEPSSVNRSRFCTIVRCTSDGSFATVYRHRRDAWPAVFQFANILFPYGEAAGPYLYATAIGLRGVSYHLVRWDLRLLRDSARSARTAISKGAV